MSVRKPYVLVGLAIVFLSFLVGVFYMYEFLGLKYFIRASMEVNKLSEPVRSKAMNEFLEDIDDMSYRGILAKVNNEGSRGVWVWGKAGLKFFQADSDSVYTFTDGCSEKIVQEREKMKEIKLQNQVFYNFDEWQQKVGVGDFVIIRSRSKIGFLKGNLGNLFSYNWWYFLQKDIKTECEK